MVDASTFTSSLNITVAGSYNISVLFLRDVEERPISPLKAIFSYNITIQAGFVDPFSSYVDGPGLLTAVVGATATFRVYSSAFQPQLEMAIF